MILANKHQEETDLCKNVLESHVKLSDDDDVEEESHVKLSDYLTEGLLDGLSDDDDVEEELDTS